MAELIRQITQRGVVHAPDTPTVEMANVSVAYASSADNGSSAGGIYALQQISLRVERGEHIAVVGPNGAGKSTLFKLIVGTLRPLQGTINIFGHGPDGHICVAYVPQRSQVDWSFPVTVEDVVMMGRVGKIGFFRWPTRRDWALVYEALARVNATHLARKQIGELSGGQQQRVFIARALAQEAQLLLLDEPLTGLDTPTQEAIFAILESLRPDEVTAMVATHDLSLAAERFDRVLLLNRQVIGFGPATAVLTPENLLRAYGGHLHRLEEGELLLTDTCCEGHE